MTTYYINSNNSAPWVAATVYSVGDRCVCKPATQNYNGGQSRVFECTTGGTSHGTTEPSWNYSLDGTTNDNDVVWTTRYPTSWDNAHCFLSMMMIHPLAAAGDWILVHKTHAETIPTIPAGGKFPGIIGVYNNPLKIICVEKDNSDKNQTAESLPKDMPID